MRSYDTAVTTYDNYVAHSSIDIVTMQQQQAAYSMASDSMYQQQQQQQQSYGLHANNSNNYYDRTLSSQLSHMSLDNSGLGGMLKQQQQQGSPYDVATTSAQMMINTVTKANVRQNEPPMTSQAMSSYHQQPAVLTAGGSSSPIDNPSNSFFVAEAIREELVKKFSKTQEMPSDMLHIKVDVYVDLLPIETPVGANSYTFNGYNCSVYRATNSETGQFVCLRRFHGMLPSTAKLLMSTIESWKKIQHTNIVSLRQVFTTKAFGDNSVIFVYDYYPASETLMSCYFASQLTNHSGSMMTNGYSTNSRPFSHQNNARKMLPEQTLWNYIMQISSGLRTIHQANLACRCLHPSKVLITGGWGTGSNWFANKGRSARIRLSFCGVMDIITLDAFLNNSTNPRTLIPLFQQEDLNAFGRLCLALTVNSLGAFTQPDNVQEYIDMIPRTYSSDLTKVIIYLLDCKPNVNKPRKSIDEIMPMIGARFYIQLDHLYFKYDTLYDELAKEVDNGRLLRLLIKLGTINERPEHQCDPNWSETGDRYMLKLFRDYIFHQFDDERRPWLDLGHVISNLNKLDVGSPEKICLMSRDNQNVIIVTFEELKRCFESALAELVQ